MNEGDISDCVDCGNRTGRVKKVVWTDGRHTPTSQTPVEVIVGT